MAVNSGRQCVKDREGFKIVETKEFEDHLWLIRFMEA